jgi:predicted ArsR family transcriptional regulator
MTTTTRKPTTKKAQLIKLLGIKSGYDVATLSERLGWQTHTTRAALSGLRKAGYAIDRVTPAGGGASRYRITSEPEVVEAHGA